MMQVILTNFRGFIRPATPAPYTVRCLNCRVLIASGEDALQTEAIQHRCSMTASELPEFEVRWETPVDDVDVEDRIELPHLH